jgi:hypothetical protein
MEYEEKIAKYCFIEKHFAKRGKFLTRMTPVNQVKHLLSTLYPIT